MKKTLTDAEMLELRQLGYLGGATIGDLIEFLYINAKITSEMTRSFISWPNREELIDHLYNFIKDILEDKKAMKDIYG